MAAARRSNSAPPHKTFNLTGIEAAETAPPNRTAISAVVSAFRQTQIPAAKRFDARRQFFIMRSSHDTLVFTVTVKGDVELSVAVTVWAPAVAKVTITGALRSGTPLSKVIVVVEKTAPASLLVRVTVPE